jgi:hypothetical protein
VRLTLKLALGRLATTFVALLAFAASGCAHTGFDRTTSMVVPGRSPDCHLDMYFQGPPPYPYVVIGAVATVSTKPRLLAIGENTLVAIRRMREQACAVGAHGLMSVAANSELIRVRKGHWKSTTGGAVAFVYVDAFGRPLPAPAFGAHGGIAE